MRRSARGQAHQARILREMTKSQRLLAIGHLRQARRLCFDRFGPMVAVWEARPLWTEHSIQDLIQRLFATTITIETCREGLSAGTLDSELKEATDGLDGVIRGLRLVAFDEFSHDAAEDPNDLSLIRRAGTVVDRLGEVADSMDVLAEKFDHAGPLALRLGGAAHEVRAAWIIARDGLGQLDPD